MNAPMLPTNQKARGHESTVRFLSQPLLLVTRGEPGPELQALIEAVRKALGG